MSKVTHLLLALPCPNRQLFKLIEHLAADFLWNKKTPRFRKEIIEAEIKEVGMKIHNFQNFSETLKLTLLKRTLSSKGFWTEFPKTLGINQCIYRGNLYVKSLVKKIDNPFWKCVVNSVLETQNEFKPKTMGDLMGLPIWNNSTFNNLNYKNWTDKGVYLIGDILSENTEFLSLNDLSKSYALQTNFMEYGAIRNSITRCLKSTKSVGKTYTKEVGPVNTFLNTNINLDVKGVSKLYRVATKYELFEMNIVESDKCAFCNTESIENLLYNCEKS